MKQIITSQKAPKVVGPYSHAIKAGGFVYCSGQIGLDPVTSQLVSGGIEEQTRQAMDNLEEVLKTSGSSFENAVKATVYLQNMDDFAVFNEVYGSYFGENSPARETVQVAKLPKNALVEISLIALV